MYRCPHCGKFGISIAQKLCIGPRIPIACPACGRKVGAAPGPFFFAMLPFLMVPFLLMIVGFGHYEITIFVAALVGTLAHLTLVPLVPFRK